MTLEKISFTYNFLVYKKRTMIVMSQIYSKMFLTVERKHVLSFSTCFKQKALLIF